MPLPLFFGVLAIAVAGWWISFAALDRDRADSPSVLRLVVLGALFFRIAGFLGAPLYEDDFYRYLWDGRVFALTGSPYGRPPAAWFGDDSLPAAFQEILSRVNFPEIPTIYGPVCELSFLVSYLVSPGALWPLKLIFLAADLGTMWLVWRQTRTARSLLLYGWCPLLIKEVAFTAHTDILAAFFLMAAIDAVGTGSGVRLAASSALAAASRIFAGMFAPLLIGWRSLSGWILFALGVAALYGPFLWSGGTDNGGLGAFAAEWEFNSFGFALIQAAAGTTAARFGGLLIFGAFYVRYFLEDWGIRYFDVLLAVFFLISPVVNPWYLILLVPLVAARPTPWGMAAPCAVLLSYLTARNLGRTDLGPFDHPWWVRPLELAPVLLLAAAGWPRRRRGSAEVRPANG